MITATLPYNSPAEPKEGEFVAKIVSITEKPVYKAHNGRAGRRWFYRRLWRLTPLWLSTN